MEQEKKIERAKLALQNLDAAASKAPIIREETMQIINDASFLKKFIDEFNVLNQENIVLKKELEDLKANKK